MKFNPYRIVIYLSHSHKDKFYAEYYESPYFYLTLMDKVKRDQEDNCQDSGQGDDEKVIGNRFKPALFEWIFGFDRKE